MRFLCDVDLLCLSARTGCERKPQQLLELVFGKHSTSDERPNCPWGVSAFG